MISDSLRPVVTRGTVFRTVLWGSRRTRPTVWSTYPEITAAVYQASDRAAIVLHVDLERTSVRWSLRPDLPDTAPSAAAVEQRPGS